MKQESLAEPQRELDFLTEEEKKKKEIEERKEFILQSVLNFKLDTCEQKVAWLLNNYPQTRNSDITLQIEYWRHFNRDKIQNETVRLTDLYHLPRLNSLTRLRARIQNEYELFLAKDEIRKHRGKLSEEEKKKAVEKKEEYTESSLIFADESGKNDDYIIVGSVWFLVPFSAYTLEHVLSEFREKSLGGHEIHFTKAKPKQKEAYYQLIKIIRENSEFIGFKAVYLRSQGIRNKQEVIRKLFYFVVAKGVEHEVDSNRIGLPRLVSFTKDAEEEGYDSLLIEEMRDGLANHSSTHFDKKVRYDQLVAKSSAENNLLQVADLFTGCLNRRLNHKDQKNWKDDFAEDFLRSIGMQIEDFGEDDIGDASIAIKI